MLSQRHIMTEYKEIVLECNKLHKLIVFLAVYLINQSIDP